MVICPDCGGEFSKLSSHKRFCKKTMPPQNLTVIPSTINTVIKNAAISKPHKDTNANDVNEKLDKITRELEALKAEKDLETSLNFMNTEEKSQMFTIDRAQREITGDATEAILKSRFKDYDDAERCIREYVQRQYTNLQNTRYGGDSILIKVSEIEDGIWDINELKKFESWPEMEEDPYTHEQCIRVFIDMSTVRRILANVARIASKDGYARQEDIHKSGAKMEGQAYVEAHVPPPNMYPKKYGEKAAKIQETSEAIINPDNNV
jgi:uncharacterized Zn finger protein (UPF0148 family)